MADLSNELDLNVPAAPSLTLDAAPAAPTLTLDPAADEKVIAESKKATPVQVEDTPLSPEEQKMVNDFAEKIDITNSQMVLQYGAASHSDLPFLYPLFTWQGSGFSGYCPAPQYR